MKPIFLLNLLLSIVVGCGKGDRERAEVHGKVRFDGVPVESGSIAFLPVEGTRGPSVGGAIQGGEYHIPRNKGPVSGAYRVIIRATRKSGQKVPAGEGSADPNALVDEVEMFIPRKYNSERSLKVDVKPGKNAFDFELNRDPP